MQKRFHPEDCREYLVAEPLGITHHRKFYGRTNMPVPEEKPAYCRMKSVTGMEAGSEYL
jgi:hypothetical protein